MSDTDMLDPSNPPKTSSSEGNKGTSPPLTSLITDVNKATIVNDEEGVRKPTRRQNLDRGKKIDQRKATASKERAIRIAEESEVKYNQRLSERAERDRRRQIAEEEDASYLTPGQLLGEEPLPEDVLDVETRSKSQSSTLRVEDTVRVNDTSLERKSTQDVDQNSVKSDHVLESDNELSANSSDEEEEPYEEEKISDEEEEGEIQTSEHSSDDESESEPDNKRKKKASVASKPVAIRPIAKKRIAKPAKSNSSASTDVAQKSNTKAKPAATKKVDKTSDTTSRKRKADISHEIASQPSQNRAYMPSLTTSLINMKETFYLD